MMIVTFILTKLRSPMSSNRYQIRPIHKIKRKKQEKIKIPKILINPPCLPQSRFLSMRHLMHSKK